MTDRTAPSSDARKRRHERDMADAHATARARDARPLMTHFTVTANGWVIDNQTGEFSRLNQESDMPEMTDVTSPAQLRHNGIVALLTEIRDRLPERTEVKVAPFDPDLAARNLDAIKHELETPMREHGECCEPAPADDLPGEPVEPGDLRAGDRVEFTFKQERITCNLAISPSGMTLFSDVPGAVGFTPTVVFRDEWADGISDVRLIERAPREGEGSDEARVCYSDECGEPCQSKQERDRDEIARLGTQIGLLSHRLGVERKSRKKVKAERDALRERLDALREDVERFSAGDPLITPLDILARDDERAAKGEQR